MAIGVHEGKRFFGQQDDEQILFEVQPHWIRKAIGALQGLLILIVLSRAVSFLHDKTNFEPQYFYTGGMIVSLIVVMLYVGWVWYAANRARVYITDRRFVRIEVGFPIFWDRRSLFWDEVLKVKGYAPNLLFRFFKVGSLVVNPVAAAGEDVRFRFVHYFEDLSNYVDKILYLYKTKPEEVKTMRPFVAKPAGERF